MVNDDKKTALAILAVILVAGGIWAALNLRDSDDSTDAAATPDEATAVATPEPTEAALVPEPTATPVPPPTVTPTPEPPATVLEAISDDPLLSEFSGIIDSAPLAATLGGSGPFTLLAPSNPAFAPPPDPELADGGEAGDAEADQGEGEAEVAVVVPLARPVFVEERPDEVLEYHVLAGALSLADLAAAAEQGAGGSDIVTLQGDTIAITQTPDGLMINGTTLITGGDVQALNGVVHSVDRILVPVEVELNVIVTLDPIRFAPANGNIDPASETALDRIIEALTGNDASVSVQGHTDDQGDAITNQNLSQARARSVVNYLIAGGIDDSRLSAQGFGPTRPVADNTTEEGRALNRRIEFVIG